MSLINDALRRAKQSQQGAESAPNPPMPHFRPVDPAPQAGRHGLGFLVPACLGLVALLGLLLVWRLSRHSGSPALAQPNSPLNVSARVLPVVSSPNRDQETRLSSPPSAATTETAGAAKPFAHSVESSVSGKDPHAAFATGVASTEPRTNPASPASGGPEPNPAVAAEPPAAVPAPLRLQGIVYDPKRASALINGRVMFVGERIRDLRLTAIHPDNVVLTGDSRTNVLSLEP